MNNLYKEAMDEINISDQCLRKVKSMNNNHKKIKKFRLKYAVVFATLVLSFFAFNIVSYAATGKDLTSHISNVIEKSQDNDFVKTKKYKVNDDTEVEVEEHEENLDKNNLKVNTDPSKDGDDEEEKKEYTSAFGRSYRGKSCKQYRLCQRSAENISICQGRCPGDERCEYQCHGK